MGLLGLQGPLLVPIHTHFQSAVSCMSQTQPFHNERIPYKTESGLHCTLVPIRHLTVLDTALGYVRRLLQAGLQDAR